MKILFTIFSIAIMQFVYAQEKLHFTRPSDIYLNTLWEYTGAIKDGKANGYGEATASSISSSYKGYWKDNDFNGKGILSNNLGIEYEGDFLNGKPHGKGTYNYPGGKTYTGDLIKGLQTGYGKLTYKDGKTEEGYFIKNEYRGTAVPADLAAAQNPDAGPKKESLVFWIPYVKNSDMQLLVAYYGEVKDGKANGYGEADITWPGNSYSQDKSFAKYKGYWANNNFQGKGTLLNKGGSKYEGDFVNGKEQGKGVYTYEGGGNYTGDFYAGQRQGKGVMTYSDGSKQQGEWGSDQFRGDGKTIPSIYVRAAPPPPSAEEKAKDEKALETKIAKEKDAKDPCKMGWNVYGFTKGYTRKYEGDYVILKEFNCTKDEYIVWRPAQKQQISGWDLTSMSLTVAGSEFRRYSYEPDKRYYTCNACDGDGTVEITVYTTKTKELPWGYFSGIETKSIKTTSKTYNQSCKVCDGAAVILR